MTSLDRKLLRNLLAMKGQVVAILLIVACGVSAWVAVLLAYHGLKGTRDAYYREYRMADVFAPVKRAPRRMEEALAKLPGVRRVRPRIVFDVTIDMPAVPEPCFGRVLSLPDRPRRIVNDVHLTSGAWFTGDGTRQVLVGDRFAKEHGLRVGDRIAVIMNERKESLRIVGTALTPEYVYMIRGAGDILPDPVHFTVLWLSTSFAEAAFDMREAANDFVATLDRDANPPAVLEDFDRLLEPYGAVGAYLRKDQLGNRFLSDEIAGLEGMATLVPAVFLGVAAFVLHMLLGRLVRTQRIQIAVFRAFGYPVRAIALHYVKLSLLVVGAGAALGTAVGIWFSKGLVRTYAEFYQFPLLRFALTPGVLVSGVGVSLLFGVLGAASAARKAARLQPAEGLRPEAPGVYRRTFLERWRGLWSRLGFLPRMVFRQIWRSRFRSALTAGGVALSASILMLGLFSYASMDTLMDFQYGHVERQDVRVALESERGIDALYEMRRLPGVRRAEAELVVPAKLVNGLRERRTGIIGIARDSELYGLVDRDLAPVPRPTDGLVLSAKLAELLGVRPGEMLRIEVLTGKKQTFEALVERTVKEYIGTSAYADLDRLSRWIDESTAVTGARLLADPARAGALSATLKDLPAVEAVTFKRQSVKVFEETLASSMGIMTTVLVVFAGVISFGVIYNAARISFSERERTLASMRVIGFTEREVARTLAGESFVLTAVGVPAGLALGWLFCWALSRIYDTDLYRFPLVIHPATVLLAVAGVVAFTVLANLAVRRRVKRLDLVAALKTRE